MDWCFLDKTLFSIEHLKAIHAAVPKYSFYNITLAALFTPRMVMTVLFPSCIAILLCVLTKHKRSQRFLLGTLAAFYTLIVILLLRNRVVINVTTPLALMCVIELIGFQPELPRNRNCRRSALAFAMILVLPFLLLTTSLATPNSHQDYPELKDYIARSDGKFIVKSVLYNAVFYANGPAVELKREDCMDNAVKSGSGGTFSPEYYWQMRQWGYQQNEADRLFLKLPDSETLFYVGGNGEIMAEYGWGSDIGFV
jgi:hypothetical protein